jgi:MFS family permease
VADRAPELARRWPSALAAFLGVAFGAQTIPFYTLGILGPPMALEFHWSLSETFFGLTILSLMFVPALPVAGYLVDRLGVRRIVLLSLPLSALIFATFAFGTGSLILYYVGWALFALGGLGTTHVVWTHLAAQQFIAQRGLVLGIVLSGTGSFAAVAKPVLLLLVAEHGWRAGFLLLAVLPVVITLPIVLFATSRRTYSETVASAAVPKTAVRAMIASALTQRQFWLLCAFGFIAQIALAGIFPHFENMFRTGGMSVENIVAVMPALGISVMAGRLLTGWFLDRVWAPLIGFILMLICTCGFWILYFDQAPPAAMAVLAVTLVGLASGVEYDMIAYCTTRYFPREAYGSVFGLFGAMMVAGSGIGAIAISMLLDSSGTYEVPLLAGGGMILFSAVLLLFLGRYRYAT